jgi:hypothetical protein
MVWRDQDPPSTDVLLHLTVPCSGGGALAYLEIDKPEGRYRATVGTLFECQEICRTRDFEALAGDDDGVAIDDGRFASDIDERAVTAPNSKKAATKARRSIKLSYAVAPAAGATSGCRSCRDDRPGRTRTSAPRADIDPRRRPSGGGAGETCCRISASSSKSTSSSRSTVSIPPTIGPERKRNSGVGHVMVRQGDRRQEGIVAFGAHRISTPTPDTPTNWVPSGGSHLTPLGVRIAPDGPFMPILAVVHSCRMPWSAASLRRCRGCVTLSVSTSTHRCRAGHIGRVDRYVRWRMRCVQRGWPPWRGS